MMIKALFSREISVYLFIFLFLTTSLYLQMNWSSLLSDEQRTTAPVDTSLEEKKSVNARVVNVRLEPEGSSLQVVQDKPNIKDTGASAENTEKKAPKLTRIMDAMKQGVKKVTGLGKKQPEWSYRGKTGPLAWPYMKQEYTACNGKQQSPIALHDQRKNSENTKRLHSGPELEFYYQPVPAVMEFRDNIVRAYVRAGNFLRVSGIDYVLEKVHFHTPAEHSLNGIHYPMEIQLLHRDRRGRQVIVSIFAQKGSPHFLIDRMPVPEEKNRKEAINGMLFDPGLLLPVSRKYIAFDGSLTTPPCTENVGWAVLTEPIAISRQKLARFKMVMGANNRPVQPMNNRQVLMVGYH